MDNTFCTLSVNDRLICISLQEAAQLCPDEFRAMLDAAACLNQAKALGDDDLRAAKSALIREIEMLRTALMTTLHASM